MMQTCLAPNIRSTSKVQGAKCSLELAFRSIGFHVPENLISPALYSLS